MAAVANEQNPEGGLTEPHSLVEHRLEHRCQIAGRAVNDLQYLGGRGLLLQCLAEVAIPGLDFVEQTHILKGDGGLVGEGLEEGDLDRGEGLDRAAAATDDADRGAPRKIGTARNER